jgi:putative ABC transport system permease protein
VIFAFGLSSSLSRAAASQDHSGTVQVRIQQNGNGSAPTAAQDAAVNAALATKPGAAHYAAVYTGSIKATSISSQDVDVQVFGRDASWIEFAIVSGHWYTAPGAVDVNAAFLADSGLAVGDTTAVSTGSALVQVRIAGEVFDPYGGQPRLYASAQTLPGSATASNLTSWYVGLRPGTDASGYVREVNAALGPHSPWAAAAGVGGDSFYTTAAALVATLALMVAVAAGLGVLNTVLMTTRDRLHDLGIFKALGMRPGQVVVMVVCWVAAPAVIAAAIAAPVAVLLNDATVRATAGTAHTGIPASFTEVLPPSRLALLSLAALAIAVAGALLPGSWAARARPVTALRAE